MHIEEKDSLELYYYLHYERQRGMEWMLYTQENGRVTMPGIFCFATGEEMAGFRKQHGEFTQHFKEALIEPVAEALAAGLERGEELRPKTVDIRVPEYVFKQEKKPNGLLDKKQHRDNKQRQWQKAK